MLAATRSVLVAGFTALVLPSTRPARAQSAIPVGSIPASQAAPSQSPAPSPLSSSRTVDSVASALSAQLSEMRRSEDRLLSTVQWTLGAIVTVALGLAVFGWWSGTHVYKRDLDALREDSRKAVDAALTELRTSVAQTLHESVALARKDMKGEMDESLRGLQADTIAINALTESRLRKLVNDFDGALRHAISAYQAAVQGNTNYIAHALDAMTEALDAAERANTHVGDSETAELRRLIFAYPRFGEDPRAIAVKALLDRL